MAKFNEDTAWTALTAPVDTDWLLVCDASADIVKIMDISYLLVALDGDHLDIDFTPSYYTPAPTPAEADDVDDLAAHLYGIDQKLNEIDNWGVEQSDTTFTISSSDHYVEIDTSGGAVTATLPSAATLGAGWRYIIKVTDATAATTIATNGTETIEGAGGWAMTRKDEVLETISDGTNWKVLRWELPITVERSQFTYADATSFTVDAAVYELPTSYFKKVYWTAQLTLGPSTWGAGSGDITAATGFYYVYLDQSAIDAGSSPVLADSHFIAVTTEPSWNSDYNGWYNGNDKCIFGFRVSAASTIDEWFHVGEAVVFGDFETVRNIADLDTVWTDVDMSGYVPVFVTRASCSFYIYSDTVASDTVMTWRTNGQSGTTGHYVGWARYGGAAGHQQGQIGTSDVALDSTQTIEVRLNVGGDNTAAVYLNGWFFPRGM